MLSIENFLDKHYSPIPYGDPVSDLRVDCEFCPDGDTKAHLHVSLSKSAVHCFRCGYSNDWVGFVMDVTGFPYYRAIGELYSKPRMVDFHNTIRNKFLADGTMKEVVAYSVKLPEDFENLNDTSTRLAKIARKYLLARGFNDWYITRYNLGIADSLPGRVIIPIEGEYYQARKLYKWMEPKYLNPDVPAESVIFNASALDIYEEVVICEGAFSAMAVGQNAIALISKKPTANKLRRIRASNAKRFIIALEPGAFPTMHKLADALSVDGKEVIIWNFITGDPNDPAKEFQILTYDFRTKLTFMLK